MFQVVELPLERHILKVKSLNKGDANSEVTVYYQVPLHMLALEVFIYIYNIYIYSL